MTRGAQLVVPESRCSKAARGGRRIGQGSPARLLELQKRCVWGRLVAIQRPPDRCTRAAEGDLTPLPQHKGCRAGDAVPSSEQAPDVG